MGDFARRTNPLPGTLTQLQKIREFLIDFQVSPGTCLEADQFPWARAAKVFKTIESAYNRGGMDTKEGGRKTIVAARSTLLMTTNGLLRGIKVRW